MANIMVTTKISQILEIFLEVCHFIAVQETVNNPNYHILPIIEWLNIW